MTETTSAPQEAPITLHVEIPDVLKVAIRILASSCTTNETVEAAGDMVSEYARFNIWCVRSAKRSLGEAALEEVFAAAEDANNAVSQAWERCAASQSTDDARSQLETTLREWTARLREIRIQGSRTG